LAAASEMKGSPASATGSIIASELGEVVPPMIRCTRSSSMSFLVFLTAAVGSVPSSRMMNLTGTPSRLPPSSSSIIKSVFFSGMPKEAAGPVAESVTPMRIPLWAQASPKSIPASTTNTVFFISLTSTYPPLPLF